LSAIDPYGVVDCVDDNLIRLGDC